MSPHFTYPIQLHALCLTGVMGLILALVLVHLARQEALALALVASQKSQRRSGQLAAFFGFGEELPQEQFFDELQLALLTTIQVISCDSNHLIYIRTLLTHPTQPYPPYSYPTFF